MNAVHKRRMMTILISLLVIMIAIGLVAYALRQNISLFFTPTQLVNEGFKNHVNLHKRLIRVGGMVVNGSLTRSLDNLEVEFKLTDLKKTLLVKYRGILPDLFREGQGIVATGYLTNAHYFKATEVLAKHDANYMPPEIKNMLSSNSN